MVKAAKSTPEKSKASHEQYESFHFIGRNATAVGFTLSTLFYLPYRCRLYLSWAASCQPVPFHQVSSGKGFHESFYIRR
jgi:hypothetical protein